MVGCAAGRHGHHQRHAERVQPHLERALQGPPELPHRAPARPGMLAILGTLSIVSTAAAGFVGTSSHAAPTSSPASLVAFVLNLALFMIAFKLLTAAEVSWRELLPGRNRRGRVLAAAAAPGRLLPRPRAQTHHAAVRRLRPRPRPARLALPRRPADDLRGRDQRRARPPAVAAQLLLSPPARGRPAGADRPRPRSRSASRRRTSRSPSTARAHEPRAQWRGFRWASAALAVAVPSASTPTSVSVADSLSSAASAWSAPRGASPPPSTRRLPSATHAPGRA